jgi:hypothetical protein
MKKLLLLIVPFVLAVSCHKGPERIPRGEMEEIMHGILLQDQYLKISSISKRITDTTLVYEGIFEQYGYTTDDFLFSLEYYLEDPARMEKVMEKVESRLKKELEEVVEEERAEFWRAGFMRIYNLRPDERHQPQPSSAWAMDTLYVQFNKDSLAYRPHKIDLKK